MKTMTSGMPDLSPIPRRLQTNKWLVTLSVSFGTLMGAIDASIINVALPHIRGAVGATIQNITWISTGYVIAQVLVMPLTAFLGRMFGQKRVYMTCLVLFLVGSALCGVARSLPALVAWRVLQGLGAGALQPTEQAILRQTFSHKEQGMAMALFGMAVMLGPAIGPTLGGFIVDHYSWPWIFYINVPVGALGWVMVASFVHEDEEILEANRSLAEAQRRSVDTAGIALLSVGLSTLQYVLEEGARNDWFQDTSVCICLGVSVAALVGFVVRELTAQTPAVNILLFADPVFLSGTLISALMFAMLMANMFLLPIFMQELLGFTATQSGLALMPRVLVMIVATPWVGRLYNHVPPRLLVGCGAILFCLGALDMSHFTLQMTSQAIVRAIMIQGVGFACLFVPLTTAALSHIPRHKLADATGLNSLLRQIGGSVGLAVFATLLDRFSIQAQASLVAHMEVTRPEVWQRLKLLQDSLLAHGMDALKAPLAASAVWGQMIVRQAMLLAFDKVFLWAGLLFLLILPLLIFLKVDRHGLAVDHHVAIES